MDCSAFSPNHWDIQILHKKIRQITGTNWLTWALLRVTAKLLYKGCLLYGIRRAILPQDVVMPDFRFCSKC